MNEILESITKVKEMLQKEGMDPEDFFPTCVGCGYCCMESTCLIGVKLYGWSSYPCPALVWNGKEYRCKVASEKEDIGCGCCSPLNSWRKNVKRR